MDLRHLLAGVGLLSAFVLVFDSSRTVDAAPPSDPDRALLAACRNGNKVRAEELLIEGANPKAADESGNSCLHFAVRFNRLDLARLLIDHGADVNAKDTHGRSVLTDAVGKLDVSAVEMLLEAGAVADDKAMEQASWLGRTEAVNLLLNSGVSPNAGIASAAAGGRVELAKLLLERGAKINAQGKAGHIPLHSAAGSGGLETVEFLLENGADPNPETEDGETPLHSAIAGRCDLQVVKRLVDAGARLDAPNSEGFTPVRLAAMQGDKPVYDWLVAANGGKEPPPRFDDLPRPLKDKTMEELFTAISSKKKADRDAAQRELVARGKPIVPASIRAIEGGADPEHFWELFAAMGPDAETALPLLERQLTQKDYAGAAVVTIERMRPGALSQIPDDTKRKASGILYDKIVDPKADVMAGFYMMLLPRLGHAATPTILRLLRHPDPKFRKGMADYRSLAGFTDRQIEKELVTMSHDDQHLAVRAEAAEALGTAGESGTQARAALVALIKTLPPHDLLATDATKRRENYEWTNATQQAAYSLAKFGPSVIDDLVPLLFPLDAPQRNAAITVLASIGEPAVPRLIQLLKHEDEAVAVAAAVALHRTGKSAIPALVNVVRTESDEVAERASNALWWTGPGGKDALPDLLDVVGSDNRSDRTRVAAARAALKIDPVTSRESTEIQAAIPALIRVVETGGFKHQGWAAETLGGIGPIARPALPTLRKRVELPNNDIDTDGLVRDYVRRAAIAAIAAIEAEHGDKVTPK